MNFTYLIGVPVMYRVFDKTGRLIYVGQSINLHTRAREHRGQSWWWKPLAARIRIQVFPDLAAAKAAEKIAIQEETPVFNCMGYGNWRDNPYWTPADHAAYRHWYEGITGRPPLTDEETEDAAASAFNRHLWAVPS